MINVNHYADCEDLIERYPERELRHITDPKAQQLDRARAEQALTDAASEIDTYLGTRYVLPLIDAQNVHLKPLSLIRAACDIAVYRLQTLRASDDVKDARARYEDVMKLLKSMASGAVQLPSAVLRADTAANTTDNASAGLAQFVDSPSDFGRADR